MSDDIYPFFSRRIICPLCHRGGNMETKITRTAANNSEVIDTKYLIKLREDRSKTKDDVKKSNIC